MLVYPLLMAPRTPQPLRDSKPEFFGPAMGWGGYGKGGYGWGWPPMMMMPWGKGKGKAGSVLQLEVGDLRKGSQHLFNV